jgi:hypothetical protein
MFKDIIRDGNGTIILWNNNADPGEGIKEVRRPLHTNGIMCRDGYTFSVRAGENYYCSPRPGFLYGNSPPADYPGPYTHLEVGFSGFKVPKPLKDWRKYWIGGRHGKQDIANVHIFGYVPKRLVYALIKLHGGEIEPYPYHAAKGYIKRYRRHYVRLSAQLSHSQRSQINAFRSKLNAATETMSETGGADEAAE